MISIGVFASLLDLFIVNIAFPDLRRDFAGADLTQLSWVLNGYAIVFAALLVPAGRLVDLYGRRRGYVVGLGLFTLASAACAVAPSVGFLVAARVVQGAGAAILTPSSLGVVLPGFAPRARPAVIAAWAAVGAVGAAAGPPARRAARAGELALGVPRQHPARARLALVRRTPRRGVARPGGPRPARPRRDRRAHARDRRADPRRGEGPRLGVGERRHDDHRSPSPPCSWP